MEYKLGSLFDGSGGFPLSGALCGIEPMWAAEVEPYPIAVTRTRFPNMEHLGDISKVNGADIEPVDIITFGSPCQDLSVAGKRAGLKHEANGDEETTRSGLFMEAVRIIKEMREATNGVYPRFALWENVPGAFSSNKGEDFRIVCEELIKIVEPTASMPSVPQNGWNYADSYVGDGWSLAYRVFDAQYWGVPQRRRRIHLVADFRGQSAREVLFEREGVRGYFTEGRTPWQAAPTDAQDCSGAADREGESQGGAGGRGLDAVIAVDQGGGKSGANYHHGLSPTLTCTHGGEPAVAYTLKIRGGVAVDSNGKGAGKGALVQTDLSATLGCNQDQYLFQPTVYSMQGFGDYKESEQGSALRACGFKAPSDLAVAMTLDTTDPNPCKNQYLFQPMLASGKDATGCLMASGYEKLGAQEMFSGDYTVLEPKAYSFDSLASNSMKSSNPHSGCREVEVAKTLDTTDPNPCKNQGGIAVLEPKAIDQHAQTDSWKLGKDGVVQTLPAAMGMGGGHGPLILDPKANPKTFILDNIGGQAEYGKASDVNGTLRAGGQGAVAMMATIGLNGEENISPTLISRMETPTGTTQDNLVVCEPAVAYGLDRASFNQGQNAQYDFSITEESQPTLTARGPGAVCCTTGSFMQVTDEVSPTLMARDWKDPTCVAYHYIVRRLTPTECARLQGFADRWGDIEAKDSLTQKEYQFWLEVRNTHARINGRAEKDYTPSQMLTWYNKLQTDSAEYKMWGNGIALPPALYCMQGIVDALNAEEDDSWIL